MKSILLILLAALGAGAAQAQTPLKKNEALVFCYFKGNGRDGLHLASSRDGYTWTALKHDSTFLRPTVSKDRLMRDPCILRGADGLFHMVWTVSWQDKGIGYATSKDLIHWNEQRFLPVMVHEPGARNTWAPEISYDAGSKTYLIYWASTISGQFPATQSTMENGYNHRIYATSTQDFQTFTPTRLLYEPGFNVIDASIQPDGKRFVMFLKDETREPVQKNLRVAFADQLAGPYGPASAPITGNYWAEGPTAVQLGQEWLVYFDKYRDHRYGAVKSTDLTHWTDVSDQIRVPAGLRHGTIFRVSAKELKRLEQQ
ncbi:glycoside hydrolase family 43 protein [Hymenobacter sp. BT523]|uniref:glycoside hydrolase family 43 protein n=1 Tax=Hymenobacter sp. BT523 TaxID=2795725 RepID=UPI0018EA35F7|nr:glycoside hydrolase family 43 protein [Hymenobacter sp. BT523]MBJ6108014.1 glycoside hydrolase family 43 protein [Hymenobacter sp. BT523]